MSRKVKNHKRAKLKTVILLTLTLSVAFIFSLEVATAQGDYYDKEFDWDYDGRHWTWSMSIPRALYEAYKEVPVSTRVRNGLEGYGYLTTTNDYYLQMLADKLNETSAQMGYDSYDEVSFVLAFVQSLPYTSDSVTSGYDEYPRFPIETLVDGGGDCEDTSILFATITLIMNYGTVYINPPNHYAVGILGTNIPGGFYWNYNDKKYYYCETTGNGFEIGEIPEEYKDADAHIYSIKESQQYIPDIQILPTLQPEPTTTPTQPPTTSTPPTVTPTPTFQTYEPTEFDSILDNSTLIILILALIIVVAIVAAVSTQKTKRPTVNQTPTPEQNASPVPIDGLGGSQFCIFCGSSNKLDAVYCNKCGKKIA